jgi:predicted RNase H-like HicB family nuclease
MAEHVKIAIELPISIKKSGKWYIAHCKSLDLVDQGETPDMAKENLRCALEAFFLSCMERGVLFEVLQQCGFSLDPQGAAPNRKPSRTTHYINIPLHLLSSNASNHCHA